MTAANSRETRSRHAGRGLIRTGLAAAAVVVVAVVLGFEIRGPQATIALVDRLHPAFMLIRFVGVAFLIGGWPYWVKILGDHYRLSEEQCRALLCARWRLAGGIVFLELAFVQGYWATVSTPFS